MKITKFPCWGLSFSLLVLIFVKFNTAEASFFKRNPKAKRVSNYNRTNEKVECETRLSTIYSFNTWAVPFANPNALVQPSFISKEIADEVNFMLENDIEKDDDPFLAVLLQEVWTFKAGVSKPLLWLARYLEPKLPDNRFGKWVRNGVLGLALPFTRVPVPFSKYYDAAVNPYLKEFSYLPHVAGLCKDKNTNSCSKMRLLNSGLLTFSNRPIVKSGFISYKNCEGISKLATKGYLWSVHNDKGKMVLVINTHTDGWVHSHYAQLQNFLNYFLRENPEIVDVYIAGDINMEPAEVDSKWNGGLQVKRVTDDEMTLNKYNNPDDKSLDHVFYRGTKMENLVPESEKEEMKKDKIVYKSRVYTSQKSDHDIRALILNKRTC